MWNVRPVRDVFRLSILNVGKNKDKATTASNGARTAGDDATHFNCALADNTRQRVSHASIGSDVHYQCKNKPKRNHRVPP